MLPYKIDRDRIGQRLHQLRTERRWTKTELADRSGVTRALLWRMETGKGKGPSLESYSKVAKALNVPLKDFLFK